MTTANPGNAGSPLAAALSKAQGQIKGAKKDADNPFFKSKYADLASTWDACREALSANELAITQVPDMIDGILHLRTTLHHSSGETISGTMIMQLSDKANAQQLGSLITYYRRYALSAIVGIAPEDDDGNSASETHIKTKSPAEKWAASKPGTDQDVKKIADRIDRAKSFEGVQEIIDENGQFLGDLAESHPKWHKALQEKIDAKRISLA